MTTPAQVDDLWDFYVDKVDGEPASIFLNFWFEQAGALAEVPQLGVVFIDMAAPGPRGLGEEAEASHIQPFEDRLAQAVTDRGGYFVGRMRQGGRWQAVFYLPTGVDFEPLCGEVFTGIERDFATHNQADPEWSYYNQLLLPSEERRRWMSDRAQVDSLAEAGAPADAPVSAVFTLWLPMAEAIDGLLATLNAAQPTVEVARGAVEAAEEGALTEWVQVRSTLPLDLKALHRATEAVVEATEAAGGYYEGWTPEIAAE